MQSLNIVKESHDRDWKAFLEVLELAPDSVPLFENEGGKAGVQVPVLFMHGSYDWQLHVRRRFGQLKSKCHSEVGQDVTRDVDEFFQVVQALFGWSSSTCHPRLIELSRLSMLAGSACPTGLATSVLNWLGRLLPKGRHCSTGSRTVFCRPVSSPTYMAISSKWQLSPGSWNQPGSSTSSPIWEDRMFKHLLVVGDWRRAGGAYYYRFRSFSGARLCPDWPTLRVHYPEI
jgi:hypothetical protein